MDESMLPTLDHDVLRSMHTATGNHKKPYQHIV